MLNKNYSEYSEIVLQKWRVRTLNWLPVHLPTRNSKVFIERKMMQFTNSVTEGRRALKKGLHAITIKPSFSFFFINIEVSLVRMQWVIVTHGQLTWMTQCHRRRGKDREYPPTGYLPQVGGDIVLHEGGLRLAKIHIVNSRAATEKPKLK